MILGIGTDIVNIERIKKLVDEFGDKFERRIFTKSEISKAASLLKTDTDGSESDEGSKSRIYSYYAKRFAAKEAFAKAVGLGVGRGINFCDMEICNDEFGKPYITLSSQAQNFLNSHFALNDDKRKIITHLSIADDYPFACAYVVISNI